MLKQDKRLQLRLNFKTKGLHPTQLVRGKSLPVSFPVMHSLLPVVSPDDASDLPIVLEGQSVPVMKAEGLVPTLRYLHFGKI